MGRNKKPVKNGTQPRTIGTVSSGVTVIIAVVCFIAGFFAHALSEGWELVGSKKKLEFTVPVQNTLSQEEAQNIDDSIAILEENTRQNSGDADAWTQLGNAYYDGNQYKKAILAYKASLDLDSKNPDVWTDLGVMYRRNGQPGEAIKSFDKARSLDPTHAMSRYNKGVVLLHDLSDLDGAVEVWEELLEIDPNATGSGGISVKEMVKSLKQ